MFRQFAILLTIAAMLGSCGLKRKKYENPITKDTKQPDKVLYDKSAQFLRRLLLLYGVAVLLLLVLAWYLAYAAALRREEQLAHGRRVDDAEDDFPVLLETDQRGAERNSPDEALRPVDRIDDPAPRGFSRLLALLLAA